MIVNCIKDPDVNMTFSFRFQHKENISGVSQVKTSVQRGIKAKILEQFPNIEPYINEIFPKKDSMVVVKW